MNLIALTSNLWIAPQKFRFLGLEVGTRMTIIRLESGELVLISPISLESSDLEKINSLGIVRHIIIPNLLCHDRFASQLKKLYPNALLWRGEKLAEQRDNLKVDRFLNQSGNFDNDLEYLAFQGFKTILPWKILDIKETVFFHRPSRTFILTDIAFNFDEKDTLKTKVIARFLGCYKIFRPSWIEKWVTQDKQKIEMSVQQVLDWDFDRIILAHGSIIDVNGKEKFKAAYEWFLGHTI